MSDLARRLPRRTSAPVARHVRSRRAAGVSRARRERLFAASVTIILALGIGTSVTMFSVLWHRPPTAPLRPAAGTGEGQHPPYAAEPVGRHVGRQLPRLAAAEPTFAG